MGAASDRPRWDRLLIAVIGPTASGKSALALTLAEAAGAQVLSCDALQARAGLPILTAKPAPDELARVPHHLVGVWPVDQPATAAQYVQRADAVLAQLRERGTPAVLCGGTGLYLRALCDGLFEGPPADAAWRQRLRAEAEASGLAALHARLAAVDPEAARRIAPADYVRIERALEVHAQTGRPISELQRESQQRLAEAGPRYRVLRIGLDPGMERLRQRIEARARAMVEAGLVAEVEQALAVHGPLRFPPLGFDLAMRHLRGELTKEQLVADLARETGQYARRQRTWWKREPDVRWFADAADVPVAELVATLRSG